MWLCDRTRIVEGWKCPRKRYLGYHLDGRGVSSSQLQLELFLGIVIHDSLAAIATHQRDRGSVDIDLIADSARQQIFDGLKDSSPTGGDFAIEQSHLIEAMIRGFARHTWPRLMQQYPTIIAVEQEVVYDIDDQIRFMSRPDLILADAEGNWFVIEYKSTGSKKEAWVAQWSTAVQVHSQMKAIEASMGTLPTAVIVVGLYKGYVSYGKLSTPLVYGYKQNGQPPFRPDLWSFEYQKGYWRTAAWTRPGGIKQWIADMPDDVLSNQYPVTPPLFLKEDMVDRFFTQTRWREHEIKMACQMLNSGEMDAEAQQNILDVAFPQRFDQCRLGYGKSDEGITCEYLPICHGGGQLGHQFLPRELHHEPEVEQFGETQ